MAQIFRESELKLYQRVASMPAPEKGAHYYALHFHLSRLSKAFRSDYQLNIALNIMADVCKGKPISIYSCKDDDVIVMYEGAEKKILERLIFELRYLFMDDPLSYHADQSENNAFCTYYDLAFQFNNFIELCESKCKLSDLTPTLVASGHAQTSADRRPAQLPISQSLTIRHLAQLESEFHLYVNYKKAIERSPLIVAADKKPARHIYSTLRISAPYIQQQFLPHVSLTSDKALYHYLNSYLARMVFRYLLQQRDWLDEQAIAVPVTTDLLLSELFLEFDHLVQRYHRRQSIVLELPFHDICTHMSDFTKVRSTIKALGYRLAVTDFPIEHIASWPLSDLEANLLAITFDKEAIQSPFFDKTRFLEKVKAFGTNRIILSATHDALAYDWGKAMGISLFQGNFVSRLIQESPSKAKQPNAAYSQKKRLIPSN